MRGTRETRKREEKKTLFPSQLGTFGAALTNRPAHQQASIQVAGWTSSSSSASAVIEKEMIPPATAGFGWH